MIEARKGPVWRKKKKRIMDKEKDCLAVPDSEADRISDRSKGRSYPLLSYHELPDYMKDNEYILKYYRSDWPLKLAFFSLFRWHNETLNVWTHLLGLLLFMGLTVANIVPVPELADFIINVFSVQFPSTAEANISNKYSLAATKVIDLNHQHSTPNPTSPHPTPTWPFYVFLGGSITCLLSSTTCHLFCCHSRRLTTHLLNLDYVGITAMIITSFFPPIFYIFQCTPHWQIVYLTGISVMGFCTIIALLTPALSSGQCRSFRTLLFLAMGLFGLVPAVHATVANWNDPRRNVVVAYESVMALSYLIGTGFYVSRVPERWKPGWFDLAGQSHQIFHVFVVMGALAHYGAADVLLRERSIKGC